jgi:hypothetical protein
MIMSKALYKCGCHGGRFKWNQQTHGYCADCFDNITKAAPAMYEALEMIAYHHQGNKSKVGIAARDALAKAKGETK